MKLSKYCNTYLISVVLCLLFITPNLYAKPKLVLAACDWPPFYAEYIENKGVLPEITAAAFDQVGYDVITKIMPWKRAVEMAKMGKYDGVPGIYLTEERVEFFEYSSALFTSQNVLITRKDSNIKYTSLEDLKRYRIGVLRGSSYGEEFDKAGFLQKEEIAVSEQNIRKLFKKRFKIIADYREVFVYKINTKFPEFKNQYQILQPPLGTANLYLAISKKNKNHKKIVSDFNRGIQLIKEKGIFKKIIKKHGF